MKIELIGVSKIFNKNERNERKLFENINMIFEEKGIVLIKGESGNGKTTLLNIISGLDKPSSGEVKYSNVIQKNILNNFSFFFQSNNLIERLTVRENILLNSNIKKDKFNYNYASDLISRLDINEIFDKKITEISGGEKQRVSLAKVLLANNDVLIVDEPTEQLDEENATIILNELLEASKNKLVIIVSHNILLIEEYANKIIEVKDNNIFINNNDKPKQITEIKHSYIIEEIKNKRNDKKRILYNPPKYILPTILIGILFFAFAMMLLFRSNINKKLKYRFLTDNDYKSSGLIYVEYNEIDELEDLIEGLPTFDIVPFKGRIIGGSSFGIHIYYADKEVNYQNTNARFVEINDELINRYSYIGTLPTNDDEILITVKDYLYFNRNGYLTKGGEKINIDKIEDMIGLELYNEITKTLIYKIVGVVDTLVDEKFMEELFFNKDYANIRRDQEYLMYLNNSIHSAIFINEGASMRNEQYKEYNSFILPKEEIDEQQLIDFLNKLDEKEIIWSNQFSKLSLYFTSNFKMYNEFFFIFSSIIIVILLIVELLFVNIQYKNEYTNIGIILSMGYHKRNVIKDIAITKIFEYLLITVGTFLLSILFIFYYNNKMSKYLKAKIICFELDLERIFYLFIVAIGVIAFIIIYYIIRLSIQSVLKSIRYS